MVISIEMLKIITYKCHLLEAGRILLFPARSQLYCTEIIRPQRGGYFPHDITPCIIKLSRDVKYLILATKDMAFCFIAYISCHNAPFGRSLHTGLTMCTLSSVFIGWLSESHQTMHQQRHIRTSESLLCLFARTRSYHTKWYQSESLLFSESGDRWRLHRLHGPQVLVTASNSGLMNLTQGTVCKKWWAWPVTGNMIGH